MDWQPIGLGQLAIGLSDRTGRKSRAFLRMPLVIRLAMMLKAGSPRLFFQEAWPSIPMMLFYMLDGHLLAQVYAGGVY
jgi:hypothetical protein